jgi:hypothetical protein
MLIPSIFAIDLIWPEPTTLDLAIAKLCVGQGLATPLCMYLHLLVHERTRGPAEAHRPAQILDMSVNGLHEQAEDTP